MIYKAPCGLQMKHIKKTKNKKQKNSLWGLHAKGWAEWENLLLLVITQCCDIDPNILQSSLPMVDNFAHNEKSPNWFFIFFTSGSMNHHSSFTSLRRRSHLLIKVEKGKNDFSLIWSVLLPTIMPFFQIQNKFCGVLLSLLIECCN